MKTVCKKLFSLMLVALMLVSALPFAVSAAGAEAISYNYTVVIDGSEFPATDANGSVTAEELYDFLELSQGDDATIDAWIASIAPVDVTSGNVFLTVPASNNGGNEGSGNEGNGNEGNGNEGGPITTPDGEAAPEGGVISVSLTVDYKLSGYEVKTYTTSVGTLYKNFVGVPARNGYDFSGWYSSYYGCVVDITKDMIMGDDTITGIWSAAKQYTLTLDENRGAEETVNSVKQVTYGQAIGSLPTPERDGYVFDGWKLNGKIINANTIWEIPGDGTAYAQWKLESDTEGEAMGGNTATADGEVYLEIYTNGDTAAVAKSVKITDLAKDNKITQAEVESVVKKYITAKSGYTLKYEGLFDEETWWWYTRDPETNGAKSITVNRDGDDYVYVMVKNVKTVESDPTNPKTGDGIFAIMSVMMGSGAALVSLNELRKRKMI